MKSNSTLIADMYHQVKFTGESSLIQFMLENQLLKKNHMKGENFVYYKDFEQIRTLLLKPSVT